MPRNPTVRGNGEYKKALGAVREANNIRFNKRVEEAQSSLAEMQTLFDVDQLEFEKSRLTGRIRFIALLAGGILVLLLIGGVSTSTPWFNG